MGSKQKILVLLRQDEWREILEKIISIEEEHEKKGWLPDWEWHEISVPPHKLKKLVYDGVLRITHKSRSHTYYRLVDREEVKKMLEESSIINNVDISPKQHIDNIDNLFEPIIGYDDLKEIIKLSLKSDKPIHILLVGPPGSAKTLFLMEIEKLPGAKFITAGTATRVGIRDIIYEELPTILLIDELDKINDPKDLSALLTWMESGRIIITKYGLRDERRGKGWVIGACNTTRNIPQELLDRFEIFHLREYTREEFINVVTNYLSRYEGVDRDVAKYIAERVSEYSLSVREAIRISRLAKTKKEVDKVIKIIKKYKSDLTRPS